MPFYVESLLLIMGEVKHKRKMYLDTQDLTLEKRHRGSYGMFSHFCQKQMSTWSPATQHRKDQTYWDAPLHFHLREGWRHWWSNSWDWEWLLLSRPFCRGRNFHVSMLSGNISDIRIIHLGDRLLSFSLTSCIWVCILIVHKLKGEE